MSIGDLCLDSFVDFPNVFKNNLKKLKYLKISINNVYFDLNKDIAVIYRFFSSSKPKELEEIYFKSSLSFKHEEIVNIIDLINYDHIRKYKFMIAKKNFNKNSLKLPKVYYTMNEKRLMLILLSIFVKKGVKNVKKCLKIFENFKNLFKKIKQKEIEFKYI